VELRGGTIFCESEKGWEEHSPSTSPLKEASLEHDTPHVSRSISEKMTAAQEGEGILSVLLVEDDSTIRDILARLLKLAHYHIEIAEDGLEAIIMWKKGRYDLVLMDVQMPRLDGFEATRAIRKMERERGGHTPIVAMTAHASRERGRGE